MHTLVEYADTLFEMAIEFNLKIEIYGDGKYQDFIVHEFTKKAPENSPVRFMGHVTNLKQRYKNSCYFFHISGLDGLPTSLLEALSNGCVVFAINDFGIPEIIEHGDNGMLFSSPAELKKQFSEVHLSEKSKVRLSHRATSFAENELSVEVISRKWDDLVGTLEK